MVSKSEVKIVQSLRLKKFRQKYDLFVAEGEKTVRTLLSHQSFTLHRLYAMSPWEDLHTIGVNTDLVTFCTKEELKKLSSLNSVPSVIALFKIGAAVKKDKDVRDKVLFLDDIQDPGNLGTIIRIADWYGVDQVARSVGSADFYNAKVVQSSMGSIGHVSLITLPKMHFKEKFVNHYKIGASMRSSGDLNTDKKKVCLVIGNEGRGISPEIMEDIDHHLHIEGADGRVADSLNASVATGIICQMIFGQ